MTFELREKPAGVILQSESQDVNSGIVPVPELQVTAIATAKLTKQETMKVQLYASSITAAMLSSPTPVASTPTPFPPDWSASHNQIPLHLEPSTTLAEPTNSEIGEPLLTVTTLSEPDRVVLIPDTHISNPLIHSDNSSYYILPSDTSAFPIPTPIGPNDFFRGLPNNPHVPADEWPLVEIPQPISTSNFTTGEMHCCPHEPHCCQNLLDRIRKQENENIELRMQQLELIKRIEALETAANHAEASLHSSVPSQPQDRFINKELLRLKAALFLVGRTLTAEYCKNLVANIYEHEPTLSYNVDTVRAINESKRCLDAPTLSKCAVMELISLGELEGRNCLGRSTTANEEKQPLDPIKLQFIQEAVFAIYPQTSDGPDAMSGPNVLKKSTHNYDTCLETA